MTKDELMAIARDAGIARWHVDLQRWVCDPGFDRFADAIFERAAVECDKSQEAAIELSKICNEMGDYAAASAADSEAWANEKNAASIRALKINTGN